MTAVDGSAREELDAAFRGAPFATTSTIVAAGWRAALLRALAAMAVAWVPLAALALFAPESGPGGAGLRAFAADLGVHVRMLVALPLLLLAGQITGPRLHGIAAAFLTRGHVAAAELPRFRSIVRRVAQRRRGWFPHVLLILTGAALALAIHRDLDPTSAPVWHWRDALASGERGWSAAGRWHALVSLPLLLVVLLAWLWRVLLWWQFLWSVSRLSLELVPAHPDRAGGLLFLSHSLRAWTPVATSLGAIVAASIAPDVLTGTSSLTDLRSGITVLLVSVSVLFGAPILFFAPALLDAWRRGVFEYGALALNVGRAFEAEWVRRSASIDGSALQQQAFSATTDLYSVAANVHQMRIVAIDLKSLTVLCVGTLLPLAPIVAWIVPFEQLIDLATGMLH